MSLLVIVLISLLKYGEVDKITDKDACYVVNNKMSFKNQLDRENTTYVISNYFDLKEKGVSLELSSMIMCGSKAYYTSLQPIHLVAGQTLWLPKGCIVLNEAKEQVLNVSRRFDPDTPVTIYVASKRKKKILYQVNGVINVPDSCTLSFKGGKISHGVILFNNTRLIGEEGCLDDIKCEGRIVNTIDAKWFEDRDEKVLQSVFTISDTIALASNSLYLQENTINLKDRNGVVIRGNGSTIRMSAHNSFQMTLINCSNWAIDNLIFDVNSNARIGVYANNSSNGCMSNTCICNVKDETATQFGIYGALFYGSSDLYFQNCLVKDIDASSYGVAGGLIFWPISADKGFYKNIVIKDCEFFRITADTYAEGKGADCIYFGGLYENNSNVNAVVDNCLFEDFGKRAVKAQAKSIWVKNCRMCESDSFDFKHMAAIQFFGSDSVAENNIINLKNSSYGVSIYAHPPISQKNGYVIIDDNQYINKVLIRGNRIQMNGNSIISIGMDDTNVCRYDRIVITDNTFVSEDVLGAVIARGRGESLFISNNFISLEPREQGRSVAYGMDGIIVYRRTVPISYEGANMDIDCYYNNITVIGNQITGIFRVNNTYEVTNNHGILIEGAKINIQNNSISNFTTGSYLKEIGFAGINYNSNIIRNTNNGLKLESKSMKSEITDNEIYDTRVKFMQVDGEN